MILFFIQAIVFIPQVIKFKNHYSSSKERFSIILGLFPDGSESCVRTLKGPEVNNLKCQKESMEMNSLTFENGSGIINRMLRLLNRKCTGSEVLSVPSIIFSVTMTWMETTVFATILAMTALSYHRHKQ